VKNWRCAPSIPPKGVDHGIIGKLLAIVKIIGECDSDVVIIMLVKRNIAMQKVLKCTYLLTTISNLRQMQSEATKSTKKIK
jgi:hypothetical protein